MTDGEVVKKGFVRALAGRVSRRAPWWMGRCTEARRSGGEAQVVEVPSEHRRAFDDDNTLQHATAAGTHEGIHLIERVDCCLR